MSFSMEFPRNCFKDSTRRPFDVSTSNFHMHSYRSLLNNSRDYLEDCPSILQEVPLKTYSVGSPGIDTAIHRRIFLTIYKDILPKPSTLLFFGDSLGMNSPRT